MKAGIRTYLLALPAIATAIGTKIYSFPAPQDVAKPYIMLSRITGEIQNLIGSSLNIYNETWQIDIISNTDSEAETIKELVIGRLNIADRVEMGSYTVYSCSLNNIIENTDLEMTGGETSDIRKTLEFGFIRDRTATT